MVKIFESAVYGGIVEIIRALIRKVSFFIGWLQCNHLSLSLNSSAICHETSGNELEPQCQSVKACEVTRW